MTSQASFTSHETIVHNGVESATFAETRHEDTQSQLQSHGTDKFNSASKAAGALYQQDQAFESSSLPDWACTTTTSGSRVPLFWEGADMGYFRYHQEQKAEQGTF
jgi:hypothetical protein